MARRVALLASFGFVVLIGGELLSAPLASANTPCQSTTNENSLPAECGGSYAVAAVVPPPRPDKPVTITSPTGGQAFDTNPITVEGTCPAGSLVKVLTNGILVGSVICGSNGRFSVQVDLVIGRNDLTAFPYNTIDQQGPNGNTVTVTLNAPPGGAGFSTELLLQTTAYYRGLKPGDEVVWPLEIVGGTAPYAVSVDWGDGTTDLLTRLAPGPFTVSHTYKKAGTGYLSTFPLIVRAKDSANHSAYLQVTSIVNDPKGSTNSGSSTSAKKFDIAVIWPILIVLFFLVLAFWLGERREKHIMEKRLEALA